MSSRWWATRPLRLAVMGYDRRPATQDEIVAMEEDYVRPAATRAGCHRPLARTGLSPTAFAALDEMVALAKVVKAHEAADDRPRAQL